MIATSGGRSSAAQGQPITVVATTAPRSDTRLLRGRKPEFRGFVENLSRLQFGGREGRNVGRIGEMLGLQAE